MLIFVLRRTLISIPVLLASSIIVYALVAYAGNPLADFINKNPPPPAFAIAQRRKDLGLDEAFPVRYWKWLSHFVRGDFGTSSQFQGLDVAGDLWHRLGVTTLMVALAMVLAVVFAIVSGVLAAVKQYTTTDYLLTFLGFVFLSVPVFFLAGLVKQGAIKINNDTKSQSLLTTGDSTPLTTGFTNTLTDRLSHLVLPTIALAAISYATWSRFQRAAMLDVLNSDYIRLARAKGLSRRRVMIRHALRTALIPLTTVVAIDVGGILGGAVLTERVFVWHGMGDMLLVSVANQDVNRVLAWLMVSALLVIIFNLIADVLYAFLDPRIRYA
jgi:peptide/nickel transport system permease protein